jgi:hypothetical protein
MMFLKWALLAFITVILMIVQTIFQPVIALFVKPDGNLPYFLKWFQPFDTLATGDENFWNNEMKGVTSNYLRCLFWGWRNPAWGFMGYAGFITSNLSEFTSSGNEIDIGDFGYTLGSVFRTVKNNSTKYFDYKRAGAWNSNYGWMIQFGWSLNGVDKSPAGEVCRLCIDIRPKIKLTKG